MRKIILLFILIPSAYLLNAQSVGIGTTTPNASAQLDVASTNKGLLVPRMTSTNRILISSPANGLVVYDTTQNRMYQYQNGVWRFLINNDYWVQSTTRNWVYNGTDSVGIGTASPTQRLDVNGNIRSRDDLLADGKVIATGIVSGSALQTPGNLLVSGISFLNGDVSTNGDLNMDGTGATLQLKSSNVNKGYFQLSGNNVRLGTNSGNTGSLIIRMNGNDRLTIDQSGNTNIDGYLNIGAKLYNTSATGVSPLTPLCYGSVSSTGAINTGTGNFTVTKLSTGNYEITCTGISVNSVILSSVPYQTATSSPFNNYPDKVVIRTWSTNSGIVADHSFFFIIYGSD